jgi:Flp pilus assembly protein TadD
LRYRPHDADAYRNLGVAFAQQGKVVEAAGEFRRALEIRPDDPELKVYLARALAAARDSAK